jgi:hypothetical protein
MSLNKTLYRSVSAHPLQIQRWQHGRIIVSLGFAIQIMHSAPFSSADVLSAFSLFSMPKISCIRKTTPFEINFCFIGFNISAADWSDERSMLHIVICT